ncbi:MAG: hypothetical protein LBQ75_03430 [Zoogloeaceae bacterium]|jgi:ribosomal protein L12E/L44/L45/RPP1/RPP2|nr:hypothetical protein [Zoogloeaceae bacterium]
MTFSIPDFMIAVPGLAAAIMALLIYLVIAVFSIVKSQKKERTRISNLLNARSSVSLDELVYEIASSEMASAGCNISKIKENLILVSEELEVPVDKIRASDLIHDLIRKGDFGTDLLDLYPALSELSPDGTIGELVVLLARENS